jgi:hypothetical protein
MNNLAVIVPFYKRERLTRLCFERLRKQSKKLKFDVIVAGSEREKSKQLAKDFKYIETENRPLGKKLNALLKECANYDGVIIIGSDNFMSDSLIKIYQEIDCSKPLFYSFNDIYIYSSKYNTIKSDFDYTRAGNGIGVARLYTKSTLELMNYEIWSNERLKGMDGNADKRLKSKGVKEIQLDLGSHFLIDVKIESNISAHEIVFSGHKEHDLSILNKLGKTGEKIQQIEAKEVEKLNLYKTDIPKKKAKVIKDFNGHKKGSVIELKEQHYSKLIKAKFITPFA